MFNRLSHFFSSKRKKSSSKQRSDSETSVPSPPLSPCPLQSEQEEELDTPTPSRKEWDISVPCLAQTTTGPEHFETLSQSSGESTSSTVSIVTCNDVSTNITPRTLDLAITRLDSNTQEVFPESRAQDNCQQSSVDQSSTEGSREDNRVNQEGLSEVKCPLSEVIATPTVPLSHVKSAPASQNTVNTKDNQDFNQREAAFSSFALDFTQQANEKCPSTQKEKAGTTKRKLRRSCGQEHVLGTNDPLFPLKLHKAILVETYLGEEDINKKEGDNLKCITKDWQEGPQTDMPLVLALPVTVVSEDSDTQSTRDSPSDTPMEQRAGSSQEFHTSLLQTKGSSSHDESKLSTPQEKHTSGDVCVTRKTVNLPSKLKVVPQEAQSLAQEKPTKEDNRELPSIMLKTTKPQL